MSPDRTEPIPEGFQVELDPSAKWLDELTLYGGSPPRVLKLSPAGRAAFAQLLAGPLTTEPARRLARRFVDAGVAHPRPPAVSAPAVTVVIPTRDRAAELDRCLAAVGRRYPVVVVDDASRDPAAVADVAARHGANLVVRALNGGPGPARNTGLRDVGTELVAFIDTDCVPSADWIELLAAHLQDPLMVAAAPRIVPLSTATSAERYAAVKGSLDLGPDEARVAPLTRVSYVPTAAILFRRSALGERPFDEALRYGEDVDLIWRLLAAGQRIRYVPAVEVRHGEPTTWPRLLERRFRYGTSAAALARRHPRNSAALMLSPWPGATVAAVLAGRPAMAAGAFGASVLSTSRALRRAGVPASGLVGASGDAVRQTWLNLGNYAAQFGLPLVLAQARRRRLLPALALLASPGLQAWITSDRKVNPVVMVAGQLADNVAYGAGVWRGCLAERTLRPLRPVLIGKPLRFFGGSGSSGGSDGSDGSGGSAGSGVAGPPQVEVPTAGGAGGA